MLLWPPASGTCDIGMIKAMSDGVALRVKPSPGSYRCRWELPPGFGHEGAEAESSTPAARERKRPLWPWRWPRIRRSERRARQSRGHASTGAGSESPANFPGRIELQAGKAPKGELYEWMPPLSIVNAETMEMSFSFPQSFELPALRGYVEDTNLEICLLDVTLRTWSPGQNEISAAVALVGVDLPPGNTPRFFGAALQVSGIDAIGGFTPLLKTKRPPAGTDYRSGEWGATGNGASAQVWSDSGAILTHEFDINFSVRDPYYFQVGFTPVVRVELAEAATIRDWLDEWVEPIQRITSVATGREETITYLALQQEEKTDREPGSRIQIFGTGITQEPFRSQAATMTSSAFTTARDGLSLLELVRTWRHQLDDTNPILETYNPVMLRREQHPRSRYLLLIQCLEGLYGYQTRSTFEERTKRHLEKRDQLIERLDKLVKNDEVELDNADLRFVKDRISKRPPESLDQALRTLFTQVHAESLLEELSLTPLIQRVDAEKDLRGRTDNALARVRNDLAHGNRGYPAHELSEVTRILERVARAHMLRTLGCSEKVQQRATNPD